MGSIPQTPISGTSGHETKMNATDSLLGRDNLLQLPELKGSFEPRAQQDPPTVIYFPHEEFARKLMPNDLCSKRTMGPASCLTHPFSLTCFLFHPLLSAKKKIIIIIFNYASDTQIHSTSKCVKQNEKELKLKSWETSPSPSPPCSQLGVTLPDFAVWCKPRAKCIQNSQNMPPLYIHVICDFTV